MIKHTKCTFLDSMILQSDYENALHIENYSMKKMV